jgi:hypothetical protein
MEDLEARKLYRILPDREAAREGYIRVVDESGEDYIYPSDPFVPVRLPAAVVRRLRGRVRSRSSRSDLIPPGSCPTISPNSRDTTAVHECSPTIDANVARRWLARGAAVPTSTTVASRSTSTTRTESPAGSPSGKLSRSQLGIR